MKRALGPGRGALATIALTLLLFAGCGAKDAQPAAPPPSVVTVSQPLQEKIGDFVEFTGNTQAFATVDVRARVKGFLKKTYFADGAIVNQGELLYQIEPDVFQYEVDSAKAKLQAAQAQLEKAKADLAIKQEMAA